MESIVTAVQPLFAWLLQTTLVGSMVICLILIAQRTLGKRLGPRWCHALWLVLLVRMVLPWAPASRFSLSSLISPWHTQMTTPQSVPVSPSPTVPPVAALANTNEPTSAPNPESRAAAVLRETRTSKPTTPVMTQLKPSRLSLAQALPVIWLVGAVMVGAYILLSNFILWWLVKQEHPLIDQTTLELFEACKAHMNVQSLVALIPSDHIKSPALFGFIRPRLLLPAEMIEQATREEMRYVFLHELAHLKRLDIYLGWLTSLLQILHWFNPLVWFAFYRMRTDRELACDALVLTAMGQEKSQEYGGAIVALLRRFSHSRPLPALAGVLENRSQLKRRMTMIAQFNDKSYRWSPLAVVLIGILAFVSLPNGEHTKASEVVSTKQSRQLSFTKIRIPSNPDNGVLSPNGETFAFVSKGCVWTVPVSGNVDPYIAGEPRKLTPNLGAWNMNSTLAWSGNGKWIAFNAANKAPASKDVYVVSSVGGKPSRVSIPFRRCGWPEEFRLSLSPDGKTLAYATYIAADDEESKRTTVFTIPVNGGEARQLTDIWTQEPAFSPDGKKIAYVKNYRGDNGRRNSDIWVIPAVGGTPVQVSHLQSGQTRGPVWSPDGNMIAFHRRPEHDDPNEMWIVPVADDGEPSTSPVSIELPQVAFHAVAGWTPDNRIGIQLMTPFHETIYSVPAPGGIATQMTPEGMAVYPKWSPDGTKIYFRWYRGEIAFVPAEGGEVTTIPIDSKNNIYETVPGGGNDISPDGKTIVFSGAKTIFQDGKKHSEIDIFTIPVAGGEPTQLTTCPSPAQDRFPCWSPDGKSVAFIRPTAIGKDEEPVFHIHIVSNEGGDVSRITSDSAGVSWAPIDWSPDGKSIAYFSRDKTIKSIPVAGGGSQVLTRVDGANRHCELAWSPDGNDLAYTSQGKMWILSEEGGTPREVKTGVDAHAAITKIGWSPDSRKIAFTVYEGGRHAIHLMENFLPETPEAKPKSANEPTLRQIEVRGRGSVHSTPSFDGRYMLNVDKETGNLVALELATGKERLLTRNTDPNWFVHGSLISQDSTQVAFYHYNPEKEDFDLRIVGLDGSDLRTILGAEIAGIFNMDAWSPDGKYIFGKFMKEPVQFVRVSTDDGSMVAIKNFDNGEASNVDVSPDGRYLAYSRTEQETSNPDIFVFDLEQNQEAPLVTHSASDKLLGWTPDGEHIFFTSDRNETWDGWLLRVVDGKALGLPEMIKAGVGDVNPIGFTKDGLFYYAFQHEAWNVYTAALDRNTGQVVSESMPVRHVGKDVCPDWSPDGQYLAYLSEPDRTKPQIIRIRTLVTGQERELKIDLPRFGWLRWCPDNRHLLITNFNWNAPSMVYKVEVETGAYTPLVKSEQRLIRQAELSADGKTLAYRIRGTGNSNWLIIKDLETGSEQELLQIDGGTALAFAGGWALSPDGRHVAYCIREDVNRPFVLKIVSVESGEARTIVADEVWQVVWTNDGRHLLFTKNHNELWRVTPEGAEPQELLKWNEMIWCPRIHPDGQRIAFHSGGFVSEMWVMENFLPKAVATTGN